MKFKIRNRKLSVIHVIITVWLVFSNNKSNAIYDWWYKWRPILENGTQILRFKSQSFWFSAVFGSGCRCCRGGIVYAPLCTIPFGSMHDFLPPAFGKFLHLILLGQRTWCKRMKGAQPLFACLQVERQGGSGSVTFGRHSGAYIEQRKSFRFGEHLHPNSGLSCWK